MTRHHQPAPEIVRAIYSPALDRFQWQLFLPGDRCVLVSGDLSRRAVVPGAFAPGDDEPHEVPVDAVPAGIREAARAALAESAERDVHALLAARREIAQVWGVGDVIAVRPDLTDDQAWAVLQLVGRHQDAGSGDLWDAVEASAAELFGPDPGGAGAA